MERPSRCFVALAILAMLATSACRDTAGPSSPAWFTGNVSDPVAAAGEPSAAGGPHVMGTGATEPHAFISLPPGTAPEAGSASIVNLRTDRVITTAIVDGGFDPVAVPALAGDTLDVAISLADGDVAHATAVVPDRKAPRVVRTAPATRRTDVALNSIIVVVFSEPIDPATLTDSEVRLLTGGNAVAGQWHLIGDDGVAIQFTPAEPLRSATTYQLVVGTGLADLAGDPLEQGLTADFTTSSSTGTITVPPEGSRLVFTGQPTEATVLTPFAPALTVTLVDALGATVTSFAGIIDLELDQETSGEPYTGPVIDGVIRVTAVGGVATFASVGVWPAGTGYTLSAVAEPAERATSSAFTILPSPWVAMPYVSGRRMGAATAVAGGRFYFIGGFNDKADEFVAEAEVVAFDPATSTWSTVAPMPLGAGQTTTDLPGRFGAAAAELGGLIYVVGGAAAGGPCTPSLGCYVPLSSLQSYDPATDSWTEREPMPTPRRDAAAAVMNGKLYVFGGQQTGVGGGALRTVEVYDPATDSWSTRSPMPTGRWNLATTTLDGVIYAVGGFGPGLQGGVDVAATVEAYLPESDTWISLPSLPSPRAGAGGAALGGRLYSVGGWGRREGWLGEGPMADVVAYSPAGGTWTQAPSPPMKGSTATGVVDGVIYAVVDGEQFYAFEP